MAYRDSTPPPPETVAALAGLSAGLDDHIPAKVVDRNLLIGTWNIQALGRITKRWTPKADDSPKRNLTDLCCIAEIVSRFDVIAIVEVKRNLEALRLLMDVLGPDWGFIVTDTVEGEPGNDERLGFVYRPPADPARGAGGRDRDPRQRARWRRRDPARPVRAHAVRGQLPGGLEGLHARLDPRHLGLG